MIIRQERPAEYAVVEALVTRAFATALHGDGTEAAYLRDLRGSGRFLPELSLVAQLDSGTIVGQIVLYETDITTPQGLRCELVLSPISVEPAYFRRGIARAMTEEALRRAKGMGYRAVFLCGDPEIYRRLGFRPSCELGIFHLNDPAHSAPWSMVRELEDGTLAGVSGTVDML